MNNKQIPLQDLIDEAYDQGIEDAAKVAETNSYFTRWLPNKIRKLKRNVGKDGE